MNNDKREVYLRNICLSDSEMIVRWRNSSDVKKYFIYQDDFTLESQNEWYENEIRTGKTIQFMIVEVKTDKAVGSVYLKNVDAEKKEAEFGIFIGDENARGRGYGIQSAKLILSYAFEEIGLKRIYLRVFSDNYRAISCYKIVGFVQAGYYKKKYLINDEYKDILWMQLFNPNKE